MKNNAREFDPGTLQAKLVLDQEGYFTTPFVVLSTFTTISSPTFNLCKISIHLYFK